MFLNPFEKSQDFLRRSQAVLKHTKALIPTKKKPNERVQILSIILLVLLTSFLAIVWRSLPSQLPLFYSRPWGEQQLATPLFLSLPTSLAFLFFLGNTLASRFLQNYPFLKRVLSLASFFLILLAAITTVRIVFLVI